MNDKPAVIIPLDGSEIATVALGAAQAMSKIMNAILYIVHVTEEMLPEEELMKKLRVEALEVRDFSIRQIMGVDPIDGILRFAQSVDTQMIVMASHGWTYNPDYMLGHITAGIVQRSYNPVMVIRPGIHDVPDANWKPRKMLVPQDGTPTAAAVMVQVFRLAELTGAEIDILNIGTVGEQAPTEAGTMRTPQYLDYPRYDWPAWASEFKERFYSQRPPGVTLRLFEREGDPARVMNDFAVENGDDLIALGWHAHLEEKRGPIVKQLLKIIDMPLILIWSRE